MSKQTERLCASLPQFAALYRNAETGRRWRLVLSLAKSRAEITEANCLPLRNKDKAEYIENSRTAALVLSAIKAKAASEAAGHVAEETKIGAWGCWNSRTIGEKPRACFRLVLPLPLDISSEEGAPKAKASKPADASSKPAQARKPRKQAEGQAPTETSAQRRARAAEEAKQKLAADLAAAEKAQAEAGKPAE